MTIEELAKELNGNQCGDELTDEQEKQAIKSGMIVIVGCSDDVVQMMGAVDNEVGAYNGATIYFDRYGLLINACNDDDCPYHEDQREKAKTVNAFWCKPKQDFPWTFETEIPHETFDIFEDGEPFCKGIIFEMESLK